MKRMSLSRTIKNTIRLEEIIMVLVRFGFVDILERLKLKRVYRFFFRKPKAEQQNSRYSRAHRIRLAIEELGPTFVKFGQILSNRADILSSELIQELSQLQDEVAPFPGDKAAASIVESFGKPVHELVNDFDPIPIASASIAQVHLGRLDDGRQIAMKIQRPDIAQIIERDLEILMFFAHLASRYIEELRHFDPVGLVEQFSKQITAELDFTREASNLTHFNMLMRNNPHIAVPKVYDKLSSRTILTMDFIHGTKLNQILSGKTNHDRTELASILANTMLEQIFIHGFFHADPHPGNILVLQGNIVCFLDFGMMGRLSGLERETLSRLLMGMVRQDSRIVTDAIEEMLHEPLEDRDTFQSSMQDMIELYMSKPLSDIDIGEILQRMISILREHHIVIPSRLMLVARAFMIAEGVGFKLSPGFSFMSVFAPFSRKMLLEQLRPEKLKQRFLEHGEAYFHAFREMPLDLAQLLKLAKKGEFGITFKLRGIEPLRESLENVGTRFTFGLVLAATLISSSLIIRAEVPPMVNGMSFFGIVGFGIAGIMSLGFLLDLVVRILKRARKGD